MPPDTMPFNVSRETQDKLERYQALLLKWNKAINLVSPKTLEEAWERHFADSLQLAGYLPAQKAVLADLGSGGGFPGLVLAMALPELDVHLIESDQRKAEFLKTVSRETQTPVTIHIKRAEDILPQIRPQIITARAFAPLPKLLDLCRGSLVHNPVLWLLKGRGAAGEIAQARQDFDFSCKTFPSQTDPESVVLQLWDISPQSPENA